MRSGWIAPDRSLRSQVPSSVVPGLGRTGTEAGLGAGEDSLTATTVFGGAGFSSVWPVLSGSRESGVMVAVTRAHSSASSGLRARDICGRAALQHEDQGHTVGGHSARDPRRLRAMAPEGVEPVGALDRAASVLSYPKAIGFR